MNIMIFLFSYMFLCYLNENQNHFFLYSKNENDICFKKSIIKIYNSYSLKFKKNKIKIKN